MSAAGQAHLALPDFVVVPDVDPASERARPAPLPTEPVRHASPVLPLMALVVALTAAAVWFVGVPQLTKPEPVARTCEVIVLKTGKTRCVANPKNGAAPKKKPARAAKP